MIAKKPEKPVSAYGGAFFSGRCPIHPCSDWLAEKGSRDADGRITLAFLSLSQSPHYLQDPKGPMACPEHHSYSLTCVHQVLAAGPPEVEKLQRMMGDGLGKAMGDVGCMVPSNGEEAKPQPAFTPAPPDAGYMQLAVQTA